MKTLLKKQSVSLYKPSIASIILHNHGNCLLIPGGIVPAAVSLQVNFERISEPAKTLQSTSKWNIFIRIKQELNTETPRNSPKYLLNNIKELKQKKLTTTKPKHLKTHPRFKF